jgi:hypothetical protein
MRRTRYVVYDVSYTTHNTQKAGACQLAQCHREVGAP